MAKKCLSQKAIHDKETKRGVGRNLSWEVLVAMFKAKREKRAKQNTQ
jgi:hypothetical protein